MAGIFVLFLFLLSDTMAAVLHESREVRSTTLPEMTSLQLVLGNLSLPPEVISEALFNQVDSLQDLLEQCEGTVRKQLHLDSGEDSSDVDNSISADIDKFFAGKTDFSSSEAAPGSEKGNSNVTVSADVMATKKDNDTSNDDVIDTNNDVVEHAEETTVNVSLVSGAENEKPDVGDEGGDEQRDENDAVDDHEHADEKDDDENDHDEEEDGDTDEDDNDGSRLSDGSKDSVGDAEDGVLEIEIVSHNPLISVVGEEAAAEENPQEQEGSGVVRRSASWDDARSERARRSAFWDDAKADVMGDWGFQPRKRGDGTTRRYKRHLVPSVDPKRYLPLISRLVDRFNYLKRSLAVCRGLLDDSTSPPDR